MNDLTQGNEGKLILKFAMPMLLGNLLQQLYQIIDSIIVGQTLGKEALAAVGASFPITFAFVSIIIGVGVGGTVVVSQLYGAKQMEQVKRMAETIYIFLFLTSLVVTLIGVVYTSEILILINTPKEIIADASSFLRIYMTGMFAFFMFNGSSSLLRGLGDSKTPMYFLLTSTILNIGLDFLFILVFGWGVEGAAFATVISQSLAFLALVVYLEKINHIIKLKIHSLIFDWGLFVKSLKIGLPTGLQTTFVALGMVALMSIVNGFGTDIVAAYVVASRIDSLAGLPAMNISMALSAFVGQNIGAGRLDRVRSGLIATIKLSTIIALSVTLIVIFFGQWIISLFTTDSSVILYGHEYLIIVGSFYVVFNYMFCLTGITRGAGDTLIPMLITLFSLWLIRIPLAYFLSDPFGQVGIWWSIPIAWIIGTLFNIIYYRTGRWKRKSIIKL